MIVLGSSVSLSEEGVVDATGVEVNLAGATVVDVFLLLLAVSTSVINKVLYPFPLGKPVGQSLDLWLT